MKEQRVRLRCRKESCGKEYLVKKSALEPHRGKALRIKCIHCGLPSVFRIGPQKATGILESERPTEISIKKRLEEKVSDHKIRLHILAGEESDEQIIPMNTGKNRVGRKSKGTEIEIPLRTKDKIMSRNHCTIEVLNNPENGECSIVLSDQSRNGTKVNGKLIEPGEEVFIDEEDIITMGKTRFRILKDY